MVISALALVASIVLLTLCVALRPNGIHMAYAHMGISALVAIGFAASFFRRNSQLRASGASGSAIAGTTSRFVGYVWTWGALCLLATYATGLLAWREWLTFTIACSVLAALSLLLGNVLQRDADAGRDDPAILKLAHGLAI